MSWLFAIIADDMRQILLNTVLSIASILVPIASSVIVVGIWRQ
jgi:hypothetical protein